MIILASEDRILPAVKFDDPIVLPSAAKNRQQRFLISAEVLVVVPSDANPKAATAITDKPATEAVFLTDCDDLCPDDAPTYDATISELAHWLAALAGKHGIRSIGLVRCSEDIPREKGVSCEMTAGDGEGTDAVQTRFPGLTVRVVLKVIGGTSARRLMNLLNPCGKPTELPGATMIWKQLSVTGFHEGRPQSLPKIGVVLRALINVVEPDGIRQPTIAIYPIDQVKEGVSYAIRAGGKVLLSL